MEGRRELGGAGDRIGVALELELGAGATARARWPAAGRSDGDGWRSGEDGRRFGFGWFGAGARRKGAGAPSVTAGMLRAVVTGVVAMWVAGVK